VIAGSLGLALVGAMLVMPTTSMAAEAVMPEGCQPGGTLIMARDQEPESLVPWISTGNGNIFAQIQLYDRLTDQLPGTTEIQPDLAESWEISDDALTYTFHLRDATFSNGEPVTAEDVKFSLDRMLDPEVQADWAFLFPNVESFEVFDEKTIVMHMKAIDASILATLSLPAGGIYPKKAFEEMGQEAFEKAPVGSGPFMVASQTLGQDLKVVKNPHYWRTGQPYLDAVDFLFIPDANARTLKIQSGEAHIAENIPYDLVGQVDAQDGISVPIEPKMVGWYIGLNHNVKPFDEKVVRQALNYAMPRDAINEAVLGNMGMISNGMMVQRGIFWDPTVEPYPFDMDKARELLAQSSVPNGFDFEVLVVKGNILAVTAAEIIAATLAELGINMTITQAEDIFERSTALDYQANMWGPVDLTSDSPDDNEIAVIFLAYDPFWKNWFSDWNDPKANDLVKRANSTTDTAERQALYAELQRYAMEEAPWITLLNAPTTNARTDSVRGFETLPVGWWRLENVCLAQ
jgi:peptide/nickel transport system substrate-binding protein